MHQDPLGDVAKVVAIAFVRLTERSQPTAPFARAKEKLVDRYDAVMRKALADNMHRTLHGEGREGTLRMLEAVCGELAAQTVVLDIVTDAVHQIIREAGLAEEPAVAAP